MYPMPNSDMQARRHSQVHGTLACSINGLILAGQENSRKWLASGIIAVVFMGIIAMLLVIAGVAFAMYCFFSPNLKPKLVKRICAEGPSLDDCPLSKVGDSGGGGNGTSQSTNVEISIQETPLVVESLHFSIQLMRDATDDFNETNILVEDISGTVYRGELCNGTKIAVQRLPVIVSGKEEMEGFQARISILAKARHTQLVTLLGYCIEEGSDVLLVYEDIESSSTLSHHLAAWRELGSTAPLSWSARLSIALDVARGLEFLHGLSSAQHSFVHGYLKASNVFLTSYEHRAKVSDYGLLVLTGDISAKTRLAAVDTQDYLPPEYYDAGGISLTKKTDIFSFGLMLVELMMGSKAFDNAHALQAQKNWATIFKTVLIDDDDKFLQFQRKYLDTAMVLVGSESIRAVAKLALSCVESNAADRPDTSDVINTLSFLLAIEGQSEDPDVDLSLSEALKKWQELEESSMSSETFQAAALRSPPQN
ncbi:hypothetical protein GOP47_0027137 [Adiantum capillus-veneris]|nr:hypothetical protein GOP47_0027137 [Adiantum capillus-veneris]